MQIYRTDPLSKQICEKCFNNLDTVAKFKRTSLDTAEKHKEKLRTNGDRENTDVRLFLGCDEDMVSLNSLNYFRSIRRFEFQMEGSELKDACTSTEDLTICCNSCKQAILDPSTVNGELELCTDLHKAIAESMRKNKVTTESVSEKLLRRRKVVPFYHELDDSLCSSLTEFTQNTEGSQCYEMPSDTDESVESDETQNQRPKRRRIEYEDENENEHEINENENESSKGSGLLMIRKPAEINGDAAPVNLEDMFIDEDEYRYLLLLLLIYHLPV